MIPVQRITFRPSTDPPGAYQQFANRLATYKAADGAAFRSIRYSCRPNGTCVAGSWFQIPYLPVLERRYVGGDLVLIARPNFVELAVAASVVGMAKYVGVSTTAILGVAALYHVVGYACFKLAIGDLRPLLADFVEQHAVSRIGWT